MAADAEARPQERPEEHRFKRWASSSGRVWEEALSHTVMGTTTATLGGDVAAPSAIPSLGGCSSERLAHVEVHPAASLIVNRRESQQGDKA